jgi:uncharacterized phage protein (predicted DNA packaging)
MVTLENFTELKTALRIDESEDDSVLTLLLNAAKSSIRNAGIKEESVAYEDTDLYKQLILLYIEMDYEYDDRKIPKLERSYQNILLQLKAGQLPDPDTTV